MKKFSKVKYFGAVAAALLAVAPIAAPVVSQVASPAVAQAAEADNYAAALDNTFNATANTNPGTTAAYLPSPNTAAKATDVAHEGTLLGDFVKGSISPALQEDDVQLKYSVVGYENLTAGQLLHQLNYGSATSYTISVSVVNAQTGATLATKTLTLTPSANSAVKVDGLTVKIGDSTASVNDPSATAASISIIDKNSQAIKFSASDFNADGLNLFANTIGADQKDERFLSVFKLGSGLKPVNDAATKWENPGVFYQVINVNNPAGTKFNTVNWYDVAAKNPNVVVAPATPAANGAVTSVKIYRPITVTTGDNDSQLAPVFDYTYADKSASQAEQIVTYTNGQTIALNADDAKTLTFYPATQGTTPDTIATELATVVKQIVARQNATVDAGGNKADSITIPAAQYNSSAVRAAIANLYKAGTYNIPLTVTNNSGYTSTVNVPVTIGNVANTPVAVSFTPYTEITKGSSFDKFAGVQFQQSAANTAIIPQSSVVVSGDVDTTTPGTYTLTYTVKNSQGNTATFTRTVVVKDGALTESNADGVVYINKADGAQIYSDQATTSATDKTLDNTTAWKFHSVVKDSAGKIVAYNLGGKQYVKASEVSTSPVKAQAGVFTVNYPANSKWSIAVYNSDLKVQKLIPAKSTWATFGTKTLKDGKSYYNLGGNQWVRTDYGFWNAK
ncbi:SLAP domain-containing protein [Schleiferilactobacillus harbinensis]|uniref:SLAP domain-containing protein n=1 Tax=Schleiferilactobacillus harbinensis TaxID=304207 RepID=UPI0039E9A9CB